MEKCRFPPGVIVKPDGVNELDPCVYEEVECYKYTGPGHAHGCVGRYSNRPRKEVGIDCTPAQYIEIEADFEFYRAALEEEMGLFYTAFINKNDLFPPPELAVDIDDSGEIDLVRLEKLQAMMGGIERRSRNKALPEGVEDDG